MTIYSMKWYNEAIIFTIPGRISSNIMVNGDLSVSYEENRN